MWHLTPDERAIVDSIMARRGAAEATYRSEVAECERAMQRLRALLVAAHGVTDESAELSVLQDGRIVLAVAAEGTRLGEGGDNRDDDENRCQ